MEITKVGSDAFIALILGAILSFVIPISIAIVWKTKKKEPYSTILIGAATFLIFALFLEKSIQALVVSIDNPVSRFLKAYPVLWALVIGFFPGIFEETGRFIAFKTMLKKQKNKTTSISYGIGHGGFEVMILLGITYLSYIYYAIMINTGTFENMINQVAFRTPDQVDMLNALAKQIASITIVSLIPGFLERTFAVLFHIGASILVFYACRDKGKFWLYPLAVILHTLSDFFIGLTMVKVLNLSVWTIEGIIGIFALMTFFGAYFWLYKNDSEVYEESTCQPQEDTPLN